KVARLIRYPISMDRNLSQDINYRNLLENIILSVTDEEREDMKAFHDFFQSVEEDVNERLEKRLHDYPAFGDSLLEMSQTLQAEQTKEALKLKYEAIIKNNWEPYILDLPRQGMMFAQMGVEFVVWYDMSAMITSTIR